MTIDWKLVGQLVSGSVSHGGLLEWRALVSQLSEELARGFGDTRSELRDVLARLYLTIRAAPLEIRQDFQGFRETMLAKTAEANVIAVGHGTLSLDPKGTDAAILWQLAVNLRAVDRVLGREDIVSTRNPNERWRMDRYGTFLVPIEREHRLEDGKNFERRAMCFHAMLPQMIGNVPVTLYPHTGLRARGESKRQPMRVAAAIFSDFDLDLDLNTPEFFAVQAARCPNASQDIIDQIDTARSEQSDILMWPELTVPPDLLAEIRAKLGRDRRGERSGFDIVAAGSWHVARAEGLPFNEMVLLDDRGGELLTYRKRLKFRVGGRAEAITPGAELPVLLVEDRLVAVAICRDFCDDNEEPPYGRMDVDLVLVPSMGSVRTIGEHQRFAKTVGHRHETRVFVVQQRYPPPNSRKKSEHGAHGFSLAPRKDALESSLRHLVQRERLIVFEEG